MSGEIHLRANAKNDEIAAMDERTTTREILNRTNEVLLRRFGRIAIPALVAGFLSYWLAWGFSRVQHWLAYALWRDAHGNVDAAIRAAVIPGAVLRLVSLAVTVLLWSVAFAAVSQVVIADRQGEDASPGHAYARLASEPGWASLLWRLCWRLAIPGFLLMTIVAGPVGYWLLKSMHVPFDTAAGRLESEILSVLLFGIPYLLYVRHLTLAIPLPVVAGESPIDPLRASAEASKPWRTAIIVACLLVLGSSNLADLHLAPMLLRPELIQPTMTASYLVWIFVSLASSLLWAWLFVFLTEIAMAESPAGEGAPEFPADPAVVPNS
ncbi:MAG: hypothetical protein WBD46_10415 [Acidobacteriaceae bacterium]